MATNSAGIIQTVSDYYSEKVRTHGATPRGVDWNDPDSQALRFAQISQVLPDNGPFTVLDLGCGYGAYYDYLAECYTDFSYLGLDISEAMVEHACGRHPGASNARFASGAHPGETLDYAVASGIFNVRQHHSETEWRAFLFDTIAMMDDVSRHGFAFNCLTKYSDADHMQERLYYADPCEVFHHCKENYSRNVALLHDYELYEFTIIVRKINVP